MKIAPQQSSALFNIIGHKGISIYKVPENTIPALEKALDAGFLIETDVQKIKDGYVLYHDKSIPGPDYNDLDDGRSKIETHYGSGFYLPTGKKPISECTLDELLTKAIFDKAWHEAALSRHAGESVHLELTETPRIATLDELITLLKKFPESRTFLELKRSDQSAIYNDGMEEEIIGILCANGLLNNTIITSSNVSTLKNIRKASSDVVISIDTDYDETIPDLTHNMSEAKRMLDEIKITFWSPPFFEVDKKLLEDTKKLGLEVVTWVQNETKKEELSEIKRLKSIGVKYLFTDQPEEALKIYTE